MAGPDETADPIRLLICDDYWLIREGLKAVLAREPTIQIIAETEIGEEVVQAVADLLPEVVLMDILLPTMDGMEATRLIKQAHPSVAVVALTRCEDTDRIMRIYRSGASAFLNDAVKVEALLATIRAVHSGGVVLHPWVADAVIQYFARISEAPSGVAKSRLSGCELDVLRLVAEGRPNKEMARRLTISIRTVQNRVANILRKLELNDRVSAAVYAVHHGLTRPEKLAPEWVERCFPGHRDLLRSSLGPRITQWKSELAVARERLWEDSGRDAARLCGVRRQPAEVPVARRR